MYMVAKRVHAAALALAFLAVSASAGAQVTTYAGHDPAASAPGANSQTAQAAFIAATGGSVGITFESALPAGVSISGGSITNSPSCATSLCGGNSTPAGSFFLSLFGGQATFNFANPINYFGGYFGGLQLANSLQFNNGSPQVVLIPFTDINTGGFSFTGFTSTTGVSSITVDASGIDIISVDDVIYGATTTATPEPGSLALLATGFAGLVGWRSRRRTV